MAASARNYVLYAVATLLAGLSIIACGSNASGGVSNNSLPSISSISLACTPSTVAPRSTSQCTATVKGTGNYSSAVTWSASAGTINASGLFTASATTGTVTITATSAQSTGISGTESITVTSSQSTSPGVSSVSVACNPASVAAGATSQCSATVQGTGTYSSAVKWSASAGSINSSGLFTAPASAGAAIITATSVQNTSISGTASVAVTVQSQTAPGTHVVMVMEENQSYSTVVGDTSNWPSLNSLIRNGALATNYYANVHPSIGNYFMLTTGQILTTNDSSTKVWNVDNIARRMLAAGVSFKIYAESIPEAGYLGGNTGLYLIRHQPFATLSDLADNHTVADEHILPFSQFATDLASGNLPAFSFIVPNIDDDAHNGTPLQADTWLQSHVVTPLSNESAFQPGGNGVLIVDFDEAADSDTTHGGGHVAPVFWGPAVKTGYTQTSSTLYQHQSMLRTVMQLLGLPNPPGAAASAPPMSEFFVK